MQTPSQRGSQFELCFQIQSSEFKVSRNSLPFSWLSPSPIRCCGQSFNSHVSNTFVQRRGPFPHKVEVSLHTFTSSTGAAVASFPGNKHQISHHGAFWSPGSLKSKLFPFLCCSPSSTPGPWEHFWFCYVRAAFIQVLLMA